MKPSRGFLASLAGVAITLFAWFTPWSWPAFPALIALAFLKTVGRTQAVRDVVIVVLIAMNSAVWGAIVYAFWSLVARLARHDGHAPRSRRS
jgi:hypothetical protein